MGVRARARRDDDVEDRDAIATLAAALAPTHAPLRARTIFYGLRFTSQAAQNLLLAAFLLKAGTSGHASMHLGGFFASMLIAALIFGVPGGFLVDRIGSRRGLLTGSTLRFICAAMFVAPFMQDHVWLSAFLYSAASQVFTPAEQALVQRIEQDAAGRCHSLLVALQYGAQGAGVLVFAPVLYFLGGVEAMAIGGAVGFGVTAALGWWLTRLVTPGRVHLESMQGAFASTATFFRTNRWAKEAVAVLSLKVMVSRGVIIAAPVFLEAQSVGNRWVMAGLLVPAVIGLVIGLVAGAQVRSLRQGASMMHYALAGVAVSALLLALLAPTIHMVLSASQVSEMAEIGGSAWTAMIVLIPAAFVFGISMNLSLISARTVLTLGAPEGHQGRVFSVQSVVTDVFLLPMLLLIGVGTDFLGPRIMLTILGGLALVPFAWAARNPVRATALALLPHEPQTPITPAVVPVVIES